MAEGNGVPPKAMPPQPRPPRVVPPRPRHPHAVPRPANLRSSSVLPIGARATPGNTSSNSSNDSRHGTTAAATAAAGMRPDIRTPSTLDPVQCHWQDAVHFAYIADHLMQLARAEQAAIFSEQSLRATRRSLEAAAIQDRRDAAAALGTTWDDAAAEAAATDARAE
eukprot:15470860-Alexandrium_andersonii.AAC.1